MINLKGQTGPPGRVGPRGHAGYTDHCSKSILLNNSKIQAQKVKLECQVLN